MAQLVARLVRNEEATSSNLVISTTGKGYRRYPFFIEAEGLSCRTSL